MSDYIKEKVEEQEQKLLGSLNLFAMTIDREGYTPEMHQRFTKRILEDFQSSLQDMEERTAALRKKIEEKKKELIIEIDGKQYNSIDAGIYNQAIDDILQLIDEV